MIPLLVLRSFFVASMLVHFGGDVTESELGDRWVVPAQWLVSIQGDHVLAWCDQGRDADGVLDFECALGRINMAGAELSASPVVPDFPGCGGPDRLAVAPGPAGQALLAVTCEDPQGRIVHVGFEGGALRGFFPCPGRADHGPHLVERADGGYWLVWATGEVYMTASSEVLAVGLGSEGRIAGELIVVAGQDEASIGWSQDQLGVAPLAGGGFVTAYYALPRYGGRAVRLRIFDAEGNATADPIDLPLGDPVAGSIRVAVDGSDRITVAWEGRKDGWRRVFAASFTADGEPLVPPREVGVPVEPDRDFALPRIARSGHGTVIVWLERATSGEAWIAARKWSPTRGPLGLVARVPASVARKWTFLEVAPVESSVGAFRVYWNPDGPDGRNEPARVRWRELSVAPGPPRPPAPAAARRPGRP